MQTFSVSQCISMDWPCKGSVMQSFDSFLLSAGAKLLSKRCNCWWFKTLRPRHYKEDALDTSWSLLSCMTSLLFVCVIWQKIKYRVWNFNFAYVIKICKWTMCSIINIFGVEISDKRFKPFRTTGFNVILCAYIFVCLFFVCAPILFEWFMWNYLILTKSLISW